MRTSALLLSSALVGLLGAGCKPPPISESTASFKKDVRRYFENLNQDALSRKELLRRQMERSERNPLSDAPTGTVLNTYFFDDGGYIVENFKDPSGVVRTVVPRTAGAEPSIHVMPPPGEEKVKELKIAKEAAGGLDAETKVRDMFEMTQDNPEKPLKAKVRYVRRVWVYDPRGAVKLNQTVVNKAAVATEWIPTEGAEGSWRDRDVMYMLPGYHRLDGEYVGELSFQWHAGTLTELARAAEVPMRPWKAARVVANDREVRAR
jgi:hypothetical protein